MAPRSLEDFAIENAVEGCVGETWGAALLEWQSRHAGDPQLRRDAAAIARDEARHAELSWTLAAWAEERLTLPARQRVAKRRREAVASIPEGAEPSVDLANFAGLPRGSARQHLFRSMAAEFWGLDAKPGPPA
jgi:hypothetical protein